RIRAAEVQGSPYNGSTVFETADGGVAAGAKNLSPDVVAQHATYSSAPTHPTVNREPLNRVPRIPIIALTAYAMIGDREKFLEAGMDGYLAKPVRMEDLEKLIERIAKAGQVHSQTEAR
ncbi:MAG TPA: response regulator, partial [Desulfonatronum sp.]|nr:response regulator [Desulfonatronum sp.]